LDKEEIVETIIGDSSAKGNKNKRIIPTRKIELTSSPVLEINHLSMERRLDDVSFKVYRSEILGITGVTGSGISEIGKILFGIEQNYSGKVFLEGKPIVCSSPEDAVLNGIGYVPKDRKDEGIIPGMSVGDNIILSTLKQISTNGFLVTKKKREIIENVMDMIDLRPRNPEIPVSSLSGGNQQKVVMARWISKKSQVLVLDEPTRGVDVGAIQTIYSLLRELASSGVSIIMISSEFEEIHDVADRMIVINKGKIVGEINPNENAWEDAFALAIR
jgi:ribose transport system ATP-binding protein